MQRFVMRSVLLLASMNHNSYMLETVYSQSLARKLPLQRGEDCSAPAPVLPAIMRATPARGKPAQKLQQQRRCPLPVLQPGQWQCVALLLPLARQSGCSQQEAGCGLATSRLRMLQQEVTWC